MSTQFVELHGLRFIGLGAVVDELTPRERVYDTLEQLTTRTERMISVGCLIDIPAIMAENRYLQTGPIKITETAPLDVWNTRYPNSTSMAVSLIVEDTKVSDSVACCNSHNQNWIASILTFTNDYRFALTTLISFRHRTSDTSHLPKNSPELWPRKWRIPIVETTSIWLELHLTTLELSTCWPVDRRKP